MTTLKDFTPQPVNENQKAALTQLADLYSVVAQALIQTLPDGPHKSSSLRNLLESKFYASQSVSHPGDYTLRRPRGEFYVPPTIPYSADAPRLIPCAEDVPA